MSTTSTLLQLHLPNSLISGISEMIGSALPAAAAPVAAPAFVRVGLRRGVEHVGEEEALRRDRPARPRPLWSCQDSSAAQLLVFTYCDKPSDGHVSSVAPTPLCERKRNFPAV